MNRSATRLVTFVLGVALALSLGPYPSRAMTGIDSDETSSSTTSTLVAPETTTESSPTTTTIPRHLPRVLLVGDSTMAGLRWFKDAKKSLSGATFLIDVESCRSVGGRSCYGREQRIPLNALDTIRAVKGPLDVVVLMAGTHSYQSTIEPEFRSVKRLTAKKGATLIVLTLRNPTRPKFTVSKSGVSPIARINSIVKRMFRHPKIGSTYVADWNDFSAGRGNWFRRDGIHLNLRGVLALGWYLSHVVAHVVQAPCPSSETGTCPMPTSKDSLSDWVRRFNVKYTETHCYEDGPKRTKVCQRDRRMP